MWRLSAIAQKKILTRLNLCIWRLFYASVMLNYFCLVAICYGFCFITTMINYQYLKFKAKLTFKEYLQRRSIFFIPEIIWKTQIWHQGNFLFKPIWCELHCDVTINVAVKETRKYFGLLSTLDEEKNLFIDIGIDCGDVILTLKYLQYIRWKFSFGMVYEIHYTRIAKRPPQLILLLIPL